MFAPTCPTRSHNGACTSLSSLAGVVAPLFAGAFVDVRPALTLGTFVVIIGLGVAAAMALPHETRQQELR